MHICICVTNDNDDSGNDENNIDNNDDDKTDNNNDDKNYNIIIIIIHYHIVLYHHLYPYPHSATLFRRLVRPPHISDPITLQSFCYNQENVLYDTVAGSLPVIGPGSPLAWRDHSMRRIFVRKISPLRVSFWLRIRTWISNPIHIKQRDVITHICP